MQIAVAPSIGLLPAGKSEATASSMPIAGEMGDSALTPARKDFATVWAAHTERAASAGDASVAQGNVSGSHATDSQGALQQSNQAQPIEAHVSSAAVKSTEAKSLNSEMANAMEKAVGISPKEGGGKAAPVLFDAAVAGRKSEDAKSIPAQNDVKEKLKSHSQKNKERAGPNAGDPKSDLGRQTDQANAVALDVTVAGEVLNQPVCSTAKETDLPEGQNGRKATIGNSTNATSGAVGGKTSIASLVGGGAAVSVRTGIALQSSSVVSIFQKVAEMTQTDVGRQGNSTQEKASDKAGNAVANPSGNVPAGANAISGNVLQAKDATAILNAVSANEAKPVKADSSGTQPSVAQSVLPQNTNVIPTAATEKPQPELKQDPSATKIPLAGTGKAGTGESAAAAGPNHAVDGAAPGIPVAVNGNHPAAVVPSSTVLSPSSVGHAGSRATANPFAVMDSASGNAVGNGGAPQVLTATPKQLEVGVVDTGHGWVQVRAEMAGGGAVQASLGPATPGAEQSLRDALPGMANFLSEQQISISKLVVHPASGSGQNGMSFAQGGGSFTHNGQNGQGYSSGSLLQQASTGMGTAADSHRSPGGTLADNPVDRTGAVAMPSAVTPFGSAEHREMSIGRGERLSVRA
ncbi:MAG: hypothetical protein ACYC46_10725 [Acidobacteriaceae bacterium]